MLKMFATQLTGLFKKIQDTNEYALEDGARLLAQAPAGDGTIFIFGEKEMAAISAEALYGQEKHPAFREWDENALTTEDRVLLLSRFSNDAAAVEAAGKLAKRGIPFVSISAAVEEGDTPNLTALADVHIDLTLTKGLLPDDEGNRFGFPSSMAALFVYYGLKFIILEILEELE